MNDTLNPVQIYEGAKSVVELERAEGAEATAKAVVLGTYHAFTDFLTTNDPRTFGRSFGTVLETVVAVKVTPVAVAKVGDALAAARAAKSGGLDFFEGTRYTTKVIGQMKVDKFHGFPRSVEGFQDAGKITTIKGGDGITRSMLKIPGGYHGREGDFEFIKEPNGDINHRYFNAK